MKKYIGLVGMAALLVAMAGNHRINARANENTASARSSTYDSTTSLKPLSENVNKGLSWLVAHQQNSGGWGQGEESQHMGGTLSHLKDTANVADTGMATLALIRSGSTASRGEYRENIRRGVDFIVREVERSDAKSLYITDIRGTRVQSKLGPYVDTFLAALVLAEVRNHMPDESSKRRVIVALDKVMDKIERNQKENGTWSNEGWAPVLAQGLAGKAINRAAQEGAQVTEKVRERVEKNARGQVDPSTARVAAGAGSAGVRLYSSAATVGAMQDSANTNLQKEQELQRELGTLPSASPKRAALENKLKDIDRNKVDLGRARTALVAQLDDPQFVAGFGSNGGEEYLSYLSIGESLLAKGGEEWQKWYKTMAANLSRVQNRDGSWSGHHCITGRNFCTAAALMTLTVDRAPLPVAAKIRRR
ncbi:MAG: terpene cyclase/mutase family protein [Acidobacteria bacterium]|nr:terpene cyclase/mutase family protein [Acidobacteriota bacterium]MBI3657357.1 terpene cyclase/mutase family protein [Acidobacteriota bacterium]